MVVNKRLVAKRIILPPCVREGREVDVELGLAEAAAGVGTRGVVDALELLLRADIRVDDRLQARVAPDEPETSCHATTIYHQ